MFSHLRNAGLCLLQVLSNILLVFIKWLYDILKGNLDQADVIVGLVSSVLIYHKRMDYIYW